MHARVRECREKLGPGAWRRLHTWVWCQHAASRDRSSRAPPLPAPCIPLLPGGVRYIAAISLVRLEHEPSLIARCGVAEIEVRVELERDGDIVAGVGGLAVGGVLQLSDAVETRAFVVCKHQRLRVGCCRRGQLSAAGTRRRRGWSVDERTHRHIGARGAGLVVDKRPTVHVPWRYNDTTAGVGQVASARLRQGSDRPRDVVAGDADGGQHHEETDRTTSAYRCLNPDTWHVSYWTEKGGGMRTGSRDLRNEPKMLSEQHWVIG